jgi:6-phospho-3-hexuloisomerase
MVLELSHILREVSSAAEAVREEELYRLADRVLAAPRVFVAGAGRTGLVAKAFAMRLMHLGRTVYAAGETITPAITGDDLLVAASCSGTTVSVLELARRAKSVGSSVFAITSAEISPLCGLADDRLLLPAGPDPDRTSDQFGNSLFEQLLLVVLDGLVLHLQQTLHEGFAEMRARHANLE